MGIEISKRDVKWGYISPIFSLGINLFLLPFVLHYLSESDLGIWYIFQSIGTMVTLFDFGFTPTLSRNIAYCWSGAKTLKKEAVVHDEDGKIDTKLLSKVVASSRFIYFIIAVFALVISLTVGTGYIKYVTADLFSTSYLFAWILYSVAVFINLYFSYFNSLMRGIGAIAEQYKSNIISKSIQLIVAGFLLERGLGLLGIVVAYFLSGVTFRLLVGYLIRKRCDNINKGVNKVHITEIKDTFVTIWHNAWRDGVVSISQFLTSQAMTLICAAFLSLSEVGIYSLSLQLVQVISKISVALNSTYQPLMQENYLRKKSEENKKLLIIVMMTFYGVYFSGLAGLVLVGDPILHIIKPSMQINKLFLIGMGIYVFFDQQQQLCASYISNTNRVPYMKSYVLTGIITVIFVPFVLLFTSLGIWGILLTQITILALYNAWKWPQAVLKGFNIGLKDFFGLCILELRRIWRKVLA